MCFKEGKFDSYNTMNIVQMLFLLGPGEKRNYSAQQNGGRSPRRIYDTERGIMNYELKA